ncbi:hypothetical protein FRB99_000272 [Tulasnella sp. 403]|nr:hypothetical protein FRB99_000272 [Tulasnella sp. 403]
MPPTNTIIDEEIQTIESIFPDDLHKEVSVAKAWKGASMPPSITLRIASDDPELAPHVYLTLHVQYSKTYPSAPATFTIKPPLAGLSTDHVKELTTEIQKKAKELSRYKQEMVFDAPIKTLHDGRSPASLAAEMKSRTEDAERVQKALEEREAHGMRERERERADRLAVEMQLDRQRKEKKLRADLEKKNARERFLNREHDESVERFTQPIVLGEGITFGAVKILLSEAVPLGRISAVEPIVESPGSVEIPPLGLCSVLLTSAYYNRSQGKKRLREIEAEVQALRTLSHPNLARIYAAELKKNHEDNQTLIVLTDRAAPLTLRDVLEQSETLRPEKAVDYLIQILSALGALASFKPDNNHDRVKYCHRACIGLKRDPSTKFGTRIQVSKAWYYCRLLDQLKSNPFNGTAPYHDENPIPRQWLSRDAEDLPHVYNQRRDIWDAGIVMLQMLLGIDVMSQYPSVSNALDALHSLPISGSLHLTLASMFDQSRRVSLSCSELIMKLKEIDCAPMAKDIPRDRAVFSPPRGGPRSPDSPLTLIRPPNDYFAGSVTSSQPTQQTSRWREEWEEIEFLGKGGFGSVVKAKFKLDGAIYAVRGLSLSKVIRFVTNCVGQVKKVKLRGENDGKIYREINALSRLNHRFIVRYHTVWIETSNPVSGYESPAESGESSLEYTRAGRSRSKRRALPMFREEFSLGGSFSNSAATTTSFPSIHFSHENSSTSDEEEPESETVDGETEEDEDEEDGSTTESVIHNPMRLLAVGIGDDDSDSSSDETPSNSRTPSKPSRRARSVSSRVTSPIARAPQMMYIQMEYVERQTLKEAIEDGLSEKESWRLFRQILEALAHIASLGIIHRDIKLTNIFIGGSGDVKIGDFGLATSSLAGIDPSDVSKPALQPNLEMTYGVGTALYTAPEVLSKVRGHANHAKADMYSLGIVFFEMCWPSFQTASERVQVLTKLRLPSITFPDEWEGKERQRVIISKLLQHNPTARPSALELSNSTLLPEQEEDAYFEEARRKILNSDEQCETFISELFQKKFDDVKQISYDIDAAPPEHSSLNDIVHEHMESLFRLHGAVHKEPLLLVPLTEVYDEEQQPVKLLDSSGRAVFLPRDHIIGFARSAVSTKDMRTPVRVKRFHIGNTYVPSPTGKQPIPKLMAALDIIHTDPTAGAAEAELIRIANEALNMFPGVNANQYEILISHSNLVEMVFGKVPLDRSRRRDVAMILSQTKPWQQKRSHLLKLGLPRVVVDEMEVLAEDVDDAPYLIERLEKIGGPSARVRAAVDDVLRTISYAQVMGVHRPIIFRPFIMLDQPHFKDGVMFEVCSHKQKSEAIARGGRYDHLISKFAGVAIKSTRAIGVHLSLEPFVASLAENLSLSVPRLIKEQSSFGYWSPSRCDVYVVSFQPNLLAERIELTAMLWQNGIRADVMYESAVESGGDPMSYLNLCAQEGILFMVWYRPKTAHRDHTYKIKSILKKTEHEVSLQELVPFLSSHIAEQRRQDLANSGSKAGLLASSTTGAGPSVPRDSSNTTAADVQVVVSETSYNSKYQKHKLKIHRAERAYALESELRASVMSGLPVIAVETSAKALEALCANTAWVTSDIAWKSILSELKEELSHAMAQQLRDAVVKKSAEVTGQRIIGLISLKEERIFLIRV